MVSPVTLTLLLLVFGSKSLVSIKDGPNCVSSTKQLVVSGIGPPSGTTGTDATLSTHYTIAGERLDKVSEITVEIETSSGLETIPLVDSVQGAASIKFHLATTALPPQGTNASVLVIPINPDCAPSVLTISLHNPGK